MPTLTEITSSRPATQTGSATVAIILVAIAAASLAWVSSASSTKNSSPPWRLTVSDSRTPDSKRRATSCSTSSPARWPSSSLICLKPLRSTNSSAVRKPWRRAMPMALPSRSAITARVGVSVSASRWLERVSNSICSAWSSSTASASTAAISNCSLAASSRLECAPSLLRGCAGAIDARSSRMTRCCAASSARSRALSRRSTRSKRTAALGGVALTRRFFATGLATVCNFRQTIAVRSLQWAT